MPKGGAGTSTDAPEADLTTWTTQILEKIDKQRAECGSDKSTLLWAQLRVTDMRNVAAMNEVRDAWIDPANPPVRAGLSSAQVAPDWKGEMMVMVAQ